MKSKKRIILSLTLMMMISALVMTNNVHGESGINVSLGAFKKDGSTYKLPEATLNGSLSTLIVRVEEGEITVPSTTTAPDISDLTKTFWLWTGTNKTAAQKIVRELQFTPKGNFDDMVVTVTVDGNTTNLTTKTQSSNLTYWKGRYYMYVEDELAWTAAYNKAKELRFMGMQGYLATLENDDDYAVLANVSRDSAWVGGTALVYANGSKIKDENAITRNAGVLKHGKDSSNIYSNIYTANDFYWASGPKAGEAMPEGLRFAYSEPNGYSSSGFSGAANEIGNALYTDNTMLVGTHESCLRANNSLNSPYLNDVFEGNYSSLAQSPLPMNNQTKGYFVEFGGYETDPGNPDITLTKSATVKGGDDADDTNDKDDINGGKNTNGNIDSKDTTEKAPSTGIYN